MWCLPTHTPESPLRIRKVLHCYVQKNTNVSDQPIIKMLLRKSSR